MPLAFVDSVAGLAVLMAVAGIVVAPVSTVAFGLLDRVAPAGIATEATSWIITAYQVGLAVGTAGAGALVEHSARGPPSWPLRLRRARRRDHPRPPPTLGRGYGRASGRPDRLDPSLPAALAALGVAHPHR